MKYFLVIALFGLLLSGCLSEKNANPGNASTFIRYFSGGYNDQAVAVEETSDQGFIILTNSRIITSEATAPRYQIKLIRTDQFGTPVWQSILPNDTSKSYKSTDIELIQGGGYVITGQDIQKDSTTKTLLMTVDENGKALKTVSVRDPSLSTVSGQAVTINTGGNYMVLNTSGNAIMILAEFKKDDLSLLWATPYAAGKTSLANRLFLDNAGKYLWSGTVTKTTDVTGIRMVKTAPQSINTEFDLTLLNPGFSEVGTDFCRYGYGYAVIGSTNQKRDENGAVIGVADQDILFKRLGSDGSVLSTTSFPLGAKDNNNDVGNSISSTQDGGLILLASVNSASISGRGDDDYLLIKIDAFGNEVWRSNFGSRFKDAGKSIRQTSDGGYVVLGTSTQGQLDIVMLAKTDKDGKIN